MWLVALALALDLARPDLARAKEAFAASREDLARAREEEHVWKARLEEAQAEARQAQGAAAAAEARGLVLAAKAGNGAHDLATAQNATHAALRATAQRATERAAALEQQATSLWDLVKRLEPPEEAKPPLPKVARALRGLVDDARQSEPAPAARASEAEANVTALAEEVEQEQEEVGELASDGDAMGKLVVATRAEGAKLEQEDEAHGAEIVAKIRTLAGAVANLTAFAPNVSAPVVVPAALRSELAAPLPAMPDPTASAVLKVQLKAAAETRAADERERIAHVQNVQKMEKELADLEQKSAALATELR